MPGRAAKLRADLRFKHYFLKIEFVMNVNFFEWLRDGVRQSVLLGVGDAIDQIGTPADNDELHPNVAALFEPNPKSTTRASKGRGGSGKRLGKSLKDMDALPAKK